MNAPDLSAGDRGITVLRLAHRPDAVTAARHRLRASLDDLGVPQGVGDDAEIVSSELLGNAVRYARGIAGGMLLLGWQVSAGQLLIQVTDGGSGGVVESRDVDTGAVHGRGLHIVERLSARWGVTDHVGGLRTVWAELPLDGSGAGLRLVT